MTDGGDSDDLWAATRPGGTPPPPPPPPSGNPPSPPDAGGAVGDPTSVMPVVGAGAAGAAAGGPPPPAPPGGQPPGDDEPRGRPAWLLPAAIALVLLLVLGLVLGLVLSADDNTADTTPQTASSLRTTTTAETTAEATTTIEPTVEPTTDPPVTDPPATDPPATEPPATEPPATDPPATEPPATEPPVTEPPAPSLPDPGFATIGSETVPIDANCLVIPLLPNTADYQVNSILATTSNGRVILDRWYDEGDAQGLDLWLVDTDKRGVASFVEDTDDGFVGLVEVDGTRIAVAANPIPEEPGDCFETVVTSFEDINTFPYTQAALDVCTAGNGPGYTVLALLTEQSRVTIVDFGDGTAEVTYLAPRDESPYVDPTARSVDEDAGRVYTALLVGEGDPLELSAFLKVPALRTCTPSEIP